MLAVWGDARARHLPYNAGTVQDLIDAVRSAITRADALAAVEAVYGEVARAVADRRPRCDASGRCCRFEAHGHRLYVTTLELAAFAAQLREPADPAWDGTGCPFQRDRLCGVHHIRPFGCRMYYCDPTATAWQNELYERLHASLKRLHDELGVPYFYVEWRAALAALGMAPPKVSLTTDPGREYSQTREGLQAIRIVHQHRNPPP